MTYIIILEHFVVYRAGKCARTVEDNRNILERVVIDILMNSGLYTAINHKNHIMTHLPYTC